MRLARASLILVSAMLFGVLVGLCIEKNTPWESSLLIRMFKSDKPLYEASRGSEKQGVEYQSLTWGDLLPPAEAMALNAAKVEEAAPLHQQIFQSIQSTFVDSYQDAMTSSNTVDIWNDKNISIHGFIVPIEINEHKRITSFFIVPYFGACIHYPPPPPNQIIYSHISEGLSKIDINSAYTFKGRLNQGLFEDPQGTSAYLLEVDSIVLFDSDSKNGRGSNSRSEAMSGKFHLEALRGGSTQTK